MSTWLHLLLVLQLLLLIHPATRVSAIEQHGSLQTEDALTVVSAMTKFGQVLQDFEQFVESQNSQDDALYCLTEQLQQSVNFQADFNSSLDKMADAVKTLTEEIVHLNTPVREQTEKMDVLTTENARQKKQLSDNEEKMDVLTTEIARQKKQLSDKEEKMDVLTTENARLKKQLSDKEEEISTVLQAIGYEHFPGLGYYKYYSEAKTWSEAVQACKMTNAQLGIINSRSEAEAFATLIARHPEKQGQTYQEFYHVGFSDTQGNRQFYTLDGVQVSQSGYNDWIIGEPNNNPAPESCGSIGKDARFNDIGCHQKLPYICELKYP